MLLALLYLLLNQFHYTPMLVSKADLTEFNRVFEPNPNDPPTTTGGSGTRYKSFEA